VIAGNTSAGGINRKKGQMIERSMTERLEVKARMPRHERGPAVVSNSLSEVGHTKNRKKNVSVCID